MEKRILWLLMGAWLLLSPVGAQNTATLIVGGQQAGPFKLGDSFTAVSKKLGAPDSSTPTSGDPSTTLKMYKNHKLAFLVNKQSKIIGITVARKDWKTSGGLSVGAPLKSFQETYGNGLKRGKGHLAFAEHGLAVTYDQGAVKTIYVVKKDQIDKAKGDYLIVGGSRVGNIRLGQTGQEIQKLLGAPPAKEGSSQNVWVYADRGIRIGFIQGRVQMIGVTSGDWVTPSGLKVGRPFSDMKKELGSGYRVESSSVFYDQWGIGARLLEQTITEILVFSPRKTERQG